MVQPNLNPAPQEKVEEPTCVHHFTIEVADGPLSKGVCLNCREVREFKNSFFGDDASAWQRPQST